MDHAAICTLISQSHFRYGCWYSGRNGQQELVSSSASEDSSGQVSLESHGNSLQYACSSLVPSPGYMCQDLNPALS